MLQQEMTFHDVFRIFRRRWSLVFIVALVCGGLAYGVARLLPKRYTSQTLVLVREPNVQEQYVTAIVTDTANQRLAAMEQEVTSRTRLESIIDELGLYREKRNKVPMDQLVQDLRTAISVTAIEPLAQTRTDDTPGFYISADFDNPGTAQQICAKVTAMLLQEDSKSRDTESVNTKDFLTSQLQDAKAQLDAQDARLEAFQREHSGTLPDDEQANLDVLSGLNSQLEASTEALNRAQQDKAFEESVLQAQVSTWQASQTGSSPETMDAQLTTEQNQLATLKSRYTNDYPDVIKLKHDIANLQAQIAEAQRKAPAPKKSVSIAEPAEIQQLRAQISGYDQEIAQRTAQQADLQKQIRMYQGRIQATPEIDQQFKELSRDHQAAVDGYDDLLKRSDQTTMAADLSKTAQGQQFQVLDPANLPTVPSFPKKSLFAGGGFAGGLLLGVGLALLLELQDTSMKSEHDIETILHLPVLAMIPTIAPAPHDARTPATLFEPAQKKLGTPA